MGNHASLELENWGPIKRGFLEIMPLSVFIGKNSTGKSYTAMLYYALIRGLRRVFFEIPFRKTERVQEYTLEKMEKMLNEFLQNKGDLIRDEIERTFSSPIASLIKYGEEEARARFILMNDRAKIETNIHIFAKKEPEIYASFSISKEKVTDDEINKIIKYGRSKFSPYEFWILLMSFIPSNIRKEIYYLPASRAGTLHSYRTITRAIISAASLMPIRGTMEIPTIPGTMADFIGDLIELPMRRSVRDFAMESEVFQEGSRDKLIESIKKDKLISSEIARKMEKEILGGEIKLKRTDPRVLPEITYELERLEVPISRVSSMIAEIAPLDIYLKYDVISRGDTMIIEEPEAHLHPDNQAKIAEVFTSLVNTINLTILVTTHSDMFLSKLANLVSLSGLSRDEKEKYPIEAIEPDRVAVYNFRKEGDNVYIEPIKVTYEGIPDDIFRKIIEDLYEETMNIHYRLKEAKEVS
jgi:predicted ATPase